MKHIAGNGFSFTRIPSPQAKAPPAANHIWIFDRSQSMGWTLGKLCDDILVHSDSLLRGDTLSLAWFSTEGQHEFIVVNHTISDESHAQLARLLAAHKRPVGLTCFSQVLAEAHDIIKNMHLMNPERQNMLMFFTDGHPVVHNYDAEVLAIEKALRTLPARALFIGYGGYYNRKLLSDMATWSNGAMVHASNLQQFSAHMQDFDPKVMTRTTAPGPFTQAFYRIGDAVYKAEIDGLDIIAPAVDVFIDGAYGTPGDDEEAVYLAAYLLSQALKADEAIDLLSRLGDANLASALTNAFTNADYAEVESKLLNAADSPLFRFIGGRAFNIVRKDALCLLDVLSMLEEDGAILHFNGIDYNRTGVKMTPVAGYPEFIRTEALTASAADLVWHSSRANVSVRATARGHVQLMNQEINGKIISPLQLGLPETFETMEYRTFTLVKDGVLNVQTLMVETSHETWKRLQPFILDDWGETYRLFLKMPLINAKIASEFTNPDMLVDNLERQLESKARLKAANYFKRQLNPFAISEDWPYNDTQQLLLKANGVKDYGFSPPMEASPIVDYYIANELVLTKKGFSLADVSSIITKLDAGRALTPREQLMNVQNTRPLTTRELDDVIAGLSGELRHARNYINRAVFAITVGKKWFDGFTERETVYRGWTFQLKQTQVAY